MASRLMICTTCILISHVILNYVRSQMNNGHHSHKTRGGIEHDLYLTKYTTGSQCNTVCAMLIIMTLWSAVLLFIRFVHIKFILSKTGGGKQIMYLPNWGIYWYLFFVVIVTSLIHLKCYASRYGVWSTYSLPILQE
jgi:hypothetical protein